MLRPALSKLYRLLFNPDGREAIPKRHINKFLPANPVIVEAGAHNGLDTASFEHYMPGCTVHAFEPVPAMYELAARHVRDRKCRNVHLYPTAIGDTTGPARIYVSSGASTASSSLLAPKDHLLTNPEVHFKTQLDIQVIRLDDWAEQNQIDRVDLLWLDLQGYELAAMKGAARLIPKVSAILTEVNLTEVYENAPLYHEVRSWLIGQGMHVDRIDFQHENQGNVLFVRN